MTVRVNTRRRAPVRPVLEPLEDRRLLSANFSESEPNNSFASADVLPRQAEALLRVSGAIRAAGDLDHFKIKLKAGDVIGVTVAGKRGLDTHVRLLDAAGNVVIGSDTAFGKVTYMPDESPLPRGGGPDTNAAMYRVVARPGTYYVEVSASPDASGTARVGDYKMEFMVARPAMEKQRVGAKQILFLDFDGETLDMRPLTGVHETVTVPPMADSLAGFKLTPADEDAVITAVVERLTAMLVDDVVTRGLNGDYDSTGRPGDFGIEIRNSRDDLDTFGADPLVSRVVIGGTAAATGLDLLGVLAIAEAVDPGNFNLDDQALVTLDWITDAVDIVSAVAPFTQVDLMAEGIAVVAAHEAGHNFGNIHSDASNGGVGTQNIMGPDITAFIGADLVLGSDDDVEMRFGEDAYRPDEFLSGVNDTLNNIAFGLATGKAVPRNNGNGHGNGNGNAAPAPRSLTASSLFDWAADEDADDDALV